MRLLALELAQETGRMGDAGPLLAVPEGPTPRRIRAVARDVARASSSPHQTLSDIYEDLLAHEPQSKGSMGFSLVRSGEQRKRSGSFYTPESVVRIVIDAALRPVPRENSESPVRVLDPAMGAGAFLLGAASYLSDSYPGVLPAEIAERWLFGVDWDPLAVEIAVLSLWLETGARPTVLAKHLIRGDMLRDETPLVGPFDAVVGNPPWGAVYTSEEREDLKARFPLSTRGSFDSFKLFLDLASRLSCHTVGMVVPRAMLTQSTHADVREILLRDRDPYLVTNLDGDAFPDAVAPACVVVFGPKLRASTSVSGAMGSSGPHWNARDGFSLASPELLALFHRLRSRHPPLAEVRHLYRIRDTGINYNRAAVAEQVLYKGSVAQDARDMARYRGRDFDRYTPVQCGGWLRHDAQQLLQAGEKLFLDWPTYQAAEKIVFRQTADRIVATLDRSGMAMGRSVIAIVSDGDVSLRGLLACLNSRLLTALYRAIACEENRVLPQVKVGKISSLPIPAVCVQPIPPDLSERAGDALDDPRTLLSQSAADPLFAWACLDRLADRLLRAGTHDTEVGALVEEVVHQIYGLSEEDVRLIGPTPGR